MTETERIKFEARNLVDVYGFANAVVAAKSRLLDAQAAFVRNPSAANFQAQDRTALVYQYLIKGV